MPATLAIETFRGGGGLHDESRGQRLERIRKELESLEKEEGDGGVLVQELQEKLEGLMGGNILTRQRALTQVVSSPAGQQQQNQPSSTTTTNISSRQEERLLKIEQMLGSDTNSTSIMERLKTAEQQLQSVNEKTLTQAASRAKVIRADLEAAAKARSKLNANAQDGIKISKLYNQLTELDGFLSTDSHVLSAIVNRLSACAELHSKSMEFGRGLDTLEGAVVDLKALLGSLEESVGSLETGMEGNMKVIQENMENLDKRLG